MALKPAGKLSRDELARYAARLLSARALSTTELRAKLRKRAAEPADVESLIASLAEYGALDDARFAGNFAETRASGGRFGKQRVLADLMAKRIPAETAREAVDNAFAEVNEEESVAQWLERKYRGQVLREILQAPAKFGSVYRRLRTAGFGAPSALRVLQRLRGQPIEIEELDSEGP